MFRVMLAAAMAIAATGATTAILIDRADPPLPIDSAVTEQNIAETICVPGWSRTRRPSTHVTNKIKLEMLAAIGEPPERRSAYILDHEIPLQLGGAGRDRRNLGLNTVADEKDKDRFENKLKCLVCEGRLSLGEAQRALWYDWRASAARFAETTCRRKRTRRV